MNRIFFTSFIFFTVLNIFLQNQFCFAGNKIKKNFLVDRHKMSLKDTVENYHKIKPDSSEIKGEKIIADYISAIGGKDALSKIMDRTTYITGDVLGIDVDIVIYQEIPDKYYQKIDLGAAEQKIIFDGENGINITGDETQTIKGEDLIKLKYEATMQLILYLKAYKVKAKLEGLEKINGEDAYKVQLIFPEEMEWTQYYNRNTKLKVKEIKPIESPNGEFINQVSFFSDYQEAGGIKYPFEIRQMLGSKKFEFKVDSIKVNTGLSDRNFEID